VFPGVAQGEAQQPEDAAQPVVEAAAEPEAVVEAQAVPLVEGHDVAVVEDEAVVPADDPAPDAPPDDSDDESDDDVPVPVVPHVQLVEENDVSIVDNNTNRKYLVRIRNYRFPKLWFVGWFNDSALSPVGTFFNKHFGAFFHVRAILQ
jgi:hypothetical protein